MASVTGWNNHLCLSANEDTELLNVKKIAQAGAQLESILAHEFKQHSHLQSQKCNKGMEKIMNKKLQ